MVAERLGVRTSAAVSLRSSASAFFMAAMHRGRPGAFAAFGLSGPLAARSGSMRAACRQVQGPVALPFPALGALYPSIHSRMESSAMGKPGCRKPPSPPLYSPLWLTVEAALRQLRTRIHKAGSRPELVDCLCANHAAVE